MKPALFLIFLFYSISCLAQGGSEIYLFDLKLVDGQVTLSNGKNITNHKGYDNQPFFHPLKPFIYFASFDDSGRSDIKYYNLDTKETKNFTQTHEREYSPTVTPGEQYLSCIIQRDNGAQDLARFPINGGRPEVLVWHLKVGYHAWTSPNKVFLYVLDDSIHNSLHNYDISTNMDTVIAENIGRSLYLVPGEQALSYVQRLTGKQNVIKKFMLGSGVSSPIINMLPGQDFFCWLPYSQGADQKRILLSSDGSRIYFYQVDSYTEFKDKQWQPVSIEGPSAGLKGISRMAVNGDHTKLAVVVSE
jgi:hypothetical protein